MWGAGPLLVVSTTRKARVSPCFLAARRGFAEFGGRGRSLLELACGDAAASEEPTWTWPRSTEEAKTTSKKPKDGF